MSPTGTERMKSSIQTSNPSIARRSSGFWCYLALFGLLLIPAGREGITQRAVAQERASAGVQGGCDIPAGEGTDCNANGVPDECDIENCPDLPACDDCNLNNLPDACDITSGLSLDLDSDGVPDECVFFDDGGIDNEWGTPENWDDDEVPDNGDLIDDESVTIKSGMTNLDLAIEVDTLRLLDGAILNVAGTTDEDFDVEEAGGILISSKTATRSELLVGSGRSVSASASLLHIRSGGVYRAANPSQPGGVADGNSDAQLSIGSILVESRCGEPVPGEMILSGQMSADVFGNVVIDASRDCVVCEFCAIASNGSAGSIAGGETPPILRTTDDAALTIQGDLTILGNGAIVTTSTVALVVHGSFVNQSQCPQCFTFSGSIRFVEPTGGTAQPALVPDIFEVAGKDLGASLAGYVGNFQIGTLEIADDKSLEFRDDFINAGGGGPRGVIRRYIDPSHQDYGDLELRSRLLQNAHRRRGIDRDHRQRYAVESGYRYHRTRHVAEPPTAGSDSTVGSPRDHP